MGWIVTLTVAVFYIGGAIASVHAALTTRTAQGAVAWAVALISFPFIALPAYLVLGRNKFSGRQAAYRNRQDEVEGTLTHIRHNLDPYRIPSGGEPSWHRAIETLTEMSVVGGNDFKLLINGDATFDDILQGLDEAQDYILFQFYMFHNDGLGQRVRDKLVERARDGIRVYVLYDEVGSGGLGRAYIKSLLDAGVEVSAFKPTQGHGNKFQLNFRNHRKMVVVDGRLGWVGGHNVGDEYLGLDPKFSPWRDTHVRLEGPVVLQLQLTILGDWYWATREAPNLSWKPRLAEKNRFATILPTGPDTRLENASLFFVSALSAAKERIWLSAAYFVPDDAVMKALQLAALRGVDVRIITTGKPDSLPVYLAAFHYIHELRDLGIRFYAYEPGFMHQKVLLVDDKFSGVGTHNFDNRSFRLNFEVMAVIVDEEFGGEMERMFEADFAHSRPIDPNDFNKHSIWWRIGVQLCRLAAPVL